MKKLTSTTSPEPNANMVLSAGFRSAREAKRFSKIYSLLIIYQKGQIDCNTHLSASMLVTDLNRNWAYKELLKMGIPDGFQYISSFDGALRWFFKTCR